MVAREQLADRSDQAVEYLDLATQLGMRESAKAPVVTDPVILARLATMAEFGIAEEEEAKCLIATGCNIAAGRSNEDNPHALEVHSFYMGHLRALGWTPPKRQ